ncbi:MAG: ACP synthase, partial [Lacisediminihabitans sp.]
MARSRKASVGASETAKVVHFAARIEDSFHEFREKRARKRGLTPVVIPYTGYGAPGWSRVLCRVLLAQPGAEDASRYKKIRGWRSFMSVPVNGVAVTVNIGGAEQTVVTDRGGVVDVVLSCEL